MNHMTIECPHIMIRPTGSMRCLCGQFDPPSLGETYNPCPSCHADWKDGTPPDPQDKSTWPNALREAAYNSEVFLARIQNTAPPDQPAYKSMGLGDTVEKTLRSFGVRKWKDCKCNKWQAWLNEKLPYKNR